MLRHIGFTTLALAGLALCGLSAHAKDARSGLQTGTPDLQAAGALAFGPDGILFVGDPQSAAIFAIDTGDNGGQKKAAAVNVAGINEKIASMLGTDAKNILINDLAVNPESGNVYLSVSRGRGPDASPVLLKVDSSGKISEVNLRGVAFAKASLPNAPADSGSDTRNQRRESITDLAYVDGRVIIAGLSNEDFASKLRSIPFPFTQADAGASVEIYHGSHGKFETRSPVRTFVAYKIANEPYLLAAYTCTPLVKFPVSQLKAGEKVKGTTIAELGNRNRPLDMIVYKQNGKDYILMANSSRGLMKITTEDIDRTEPIEQRVPDKAGLSYETIPGMEGVQQLDRLNNAQAVILVQQQDGRIDLKTMDLP